MLTWGVVDDWFIEANVTDELQKEANERDKICESLYGLAQRSESLEQRKTGYLAEIVVKYVYGHLIHAGTDYANSDFRTSSGRTIDVKAQGCNGRPFLNYEASFYQRNVDRDVDWVIFCRTSNDYRKVWICGVITKAEFLRVAKHYPDGGPTKYGRMKDLKYIGLYKDMKSPTVFLGG